MIMYLNPSVLESLQVELDNSTESTLEPRSPVPSGCDEEETSVAQMAQVNQFKVQDQSF